MKLTFHRFDTEPPVALPIIRFKGKKKGKHGFISGGLHGDELNGILLVKAFIDDFKHHKLEQEMTGELTIFPILNPTGFLSHKRRSYPDKMDLNRRFPGKKNGTFSEKMAYEIFHSFVAKADFGIDCHDAGSHSFLLPHTRVNACPNKAKSCSANVLGRLFGSRIIVERTGKKGMLSIEAHHHLEIPFVTVELGGARHAFPDFITDGVEGIKNILRFFKMIPGDVTMPKKQFILKKRFGLRTSEAGIVRFTIKLGDYVHRGDTVAHMYHPHKFEEQEVKAPKCGMVFSMYDQNIVRGEKILFSVLETKKCHVRLQTHEEVQELGGFSVEEVVM